MSQRAAASSVFFGNPEWEAMKAARRSISHRDAIRETDFLQKQFRKQWSSRMKPSPVDLREVLQTLIRKKIPFVLTGAHAIGGWTGRPRSTYDVDILVKSGRNYARAVRAMKELYPQLEVRMLHGVSAFFIPGEKESVLDVTYPHRADNEETLAHPVWVEDKGLKYRIPALECALANKYGAMLALSRDTGKRHVDAGDFTFMVKHSTDEGRQPIDIDRLRDLGEKVWPGGGGEEILRLVEVVKAGGFVDLVALLKMRQ
jgi:hypothetical protein